MTMRPLLILAISIGSHLAAGTMLVDHRAEVEVTSSGSMRKTQEDRPNIRKALIRRMSAPKARAADDNMDKEANDVQTEDLVGEHQQDQIAEEASDVQTEDKVGERQQDKVSEDASDVRTEDKVGESQQDKVSEDASDVQTEDKVGERQQDKVSEETSDVQTEDKVAERQQDKISEASNVQTEDKVGESQQGKISEDMNADDSDWEGASAEDLIIASSPGNLGNLDNHQVKEDAESFNSVLVRHNHTVHPSITHVQDTSPVNSALLRHNDTLDLSIKNSQETSPKLNSTTNSTANSTGKTDTLHAAANVTTTVNHDHASNGEANASSSLANVTKTANHGHQANTSGQTRSKGGTEKDAPLANLTTHAEKEKKDGDINSASDTSLRQVKGSRQSEPDSEKDKTHNHTVLDDRAEYMKTAHAAQQAARTLEGNGEVLLNTMVQATRATYQAMPSFTADETDVLGGMGIFADKIMKMFLHLHPKYRLKNFKDAWEKVFLAQTERKIFKKKLREFREGDSAKGVQMLAGSVTQALETADRHMHNKLSGDTTEYFAIITGPCRQSHLASPLLMMALQTMVWQKCTKASRRALTKQPPEVLPTLLCTVI